MTRYFFDLRDGFEFFRDEQGLEFDTMQSARNEATRALVDFARDAVPGSERSELAIEVRDEFNHPLFKATLMFEVAILA
jgi:hypothetical protein